MRFYADASGLGKVIASGNAIVRLSPARKLSPDVFFIGESRVPSPLPKQFSGAPDLVIEVLSPSNRDDDLIEKRIAYREAGVPEIWFVDRDNRRLLIDRLREGAYVEETIRSGRVESDVLNGFWILVEWLWSEPLPNVMSCLQGILDQ
jgi:Uma2 family endonuclease